MRYRLPALAAACLALAVPVHAANPQAAGLQVALRAQGLYTGRIDALVGPGTVRAVRTFQNQEGIPATGPFPTVLPTFLIAGYQQIGSPPNTAATAKLESRRGSTNPATYFSIPWAKNSASAASLNTRWDSDSAKRLASTSPRKLPA